MAERISRRRAWAYGLIGFAVVLFLGRLVWSYRPLNEAERRLVGGWTFVPSKTDAADAVYWFSFEADRRFSLRDVETGTAIMAGSWNAGPASLQQVYDESVAEKAIRYVQSIRAWESPFTSLPASDIRFVDEETVEILVEGEPFVTLLRRSPATRVVPRSGM